MVKLDLQRGEGMEEKGRRSKERKGGEGRRKKEKRILLNRVANVKVWEKYKLDCNEVKKKELEEICEKMKEGGEVEKGWEEMREGLDKMAGWAKEIAKVIGKAQKVEMQRTVEDDWKIRSAKAEKKLMSNKKKMRAKEKRNTKEQNKIRRIMRIRIRRRRRRHYYYYHYDDYYYYYYYYYYY